MRRTFVFVHRWLGLTVGLHLLLLALTGVVMAVDEPLHRVFGHRTTGVGSASLAQVMESVRGKTGATQDPMWVKPPTPGSGRDWRVFIDLAPQGQPRSRHYVHVDSGTGEVVGGQRYESSAFGFSFRFHHELLLSGRIGRPIVAVSGMLALVLCVVGVVIWWRGGRGFRLMVSLKGLASPSRRAKLLALHELTAAWAFVALVVSIASGIVQAKPDWFGGELRRPPPSDVRVDFARLTQALGDEPFSRVRIAAGAASVEREGVTYTVDAQTYALTAKPPSPTTFTGVMKTLHEGHYGGPLGTVIVILTGLAMVVLFLTALLSWRLTAKRAS